MLQKSSVWSEAAYSAVVDSVPGAIVIVNQEGRIIAVNTKTEELFGYGRIELLDQSIEVLVPEGLREKHRRHSMDFVADGQLRALEIKSELRGRRQDGTVFAIDVSLTPIKTEQGLLVCNFIACSQQSEEALRASEARYRGLFETAKDGILILDADTGQVRDVNPYMLSLLGYSRDEFLGRKLWEIGPFKDLEACKTAFHELQSKEYIHYKDLPLQTNDGRSIDVEFVSSVYLVNEQKMIQCNIRDMRKSAEEALGESEGRYRALFEQDSAGDFISTADGRLLACNPAFARMFGFATIEEAKEAGLDALYPNSIARATFFDRLREQKSLDNYQDELRRRDGTTLHVVERAIGVFDSGGELTEIHGYFTDESERKKNEQQIRQAQKMDAIGRLAGGVAHDFNNLLGIIIGNSELLSTQVSPDGPIHNRLAEISQAAHSGAALTQQLLAFTRQQVLEPRVLDLNAVVVDTGNMLRRLIGENIELITDLGADLGAVKADPNQLVQVILNLGLNSRDAMPRGGKLIIETTKVAIEKGMQGELTLRPGNYIALRVSDTGAGMDKETQSHIFEPFFTTKGLGKGTGLGLATVYGIVNQSNGHILVHSELGHGTTFEILLPQVQEAARMTRLETPLVQTNQGSETILVVEDSKDLREIIRQFLDLSGYRVLEAGNSAEAVQAAAQYPDAIHLILTDVVLPDVSGWVLAERLKIGRPEAKVLYMSGYAADTDMIYRLSEAACNFIQKPFTRVTLTAKVREVLNEAKNITRSLNMINSGVVLPAYNAIVISD